MKENVERESVGLCVDPVVVRIGHDSVAADDAIAMCLQTENLAPAPAAAARTLHPPPPTAVAAQLLPHHFQI